MYILASPPVFIQHPISRTVEAFSSVMFECKVQGYGYINIEWRKFGFDLPRTANINNINSTNEVISVLNITSTVGYYSGQYYCIATNSAGQTAVSLYANLSVQGKLD